MLAQITDYTNVFGTIIEIGKVSRVITVGTKVLYYFRRMQQIVGIWQMKAMLIESFANQDLISGRSADIINFMVVGVLLFLQFKGEGKWINSDESVMAEGGYGKIGTYIRKIGFNPFAEAAYKDSLIPGLSPN